MSQQRNTGIHTSSQVDIVQLELLHARYITHAFTPHFHEDFAIGVILYGVFAEIP